MQNQKEWIEKAKTLPSRKLEQEVAKVAPKEASPAKTSFVTESRMHLSLDLEKRILDQLRRVQDLESQRQKHAVNLEEALDAMSQCYLQKNDPIEKAKRAFAKPQTGQKSTDVTGHIPLQYAQKRQALPAKLEHAVTLRDQGQCTALYPNGQRCEQKRWLEAHHIIPVAKSGANALENLTTLCSGHHKMQHTQKCTRDVSEIISF